MQDKIVSGMISKASSPYEASVMILRVIIRADMKHKPLYGFSGYGPIFVYFSLCDCKFHFESIQRKDPKGLVMRCSVIDTEAIIRRVACKYSFSQIAVSAISSRKIMTHREFFDFAKKFIEQI